MTRTTRWLPPGLCFPLILACQAGTANRSLKLGPALSGSVQDDLEVMESRDSGLPGFEDGDVRFFLDSVVAGDFTSTVATVLGEADPVDLTLDFDGQFGFRLGQEIFVADGLSVRYGVDFRRFDPTDPRNDAGDLSGFFSFGEVDYLELFVGGRWMPEQLGFGPEGRIRPFFELKHGWVDGIDSVVDVDFQNEFLTNQSFEFQSDSYVVGGATLGLLYPVNERLAAYLGWTKEISIGSISDDVTLYPVSALPDFAVPIGMGIDPDGWLVFFGISYGI